MQHSSDTAILIPSYQPDDKLAPYVSALSEAGFCRVVVVDDGGGEKYAPIFAGVAEIAGVTVLTHPVNRGKGAALRTGFAWIEQHCPEAKYIITADSDGQHTVPDTLAMAARLHDDSNCGLLLGTRDFGLSHVPLRSRMGNRSTTLAFFLLYGRWIKDTQTGLRGLSRELLPRMQRLRGDRYEYEMNMLIDAATAKLPITTMDIETVYENNNEGSHYRPFQDSMRIFRVIFAGFFRYIGASLFSFVVDFALFQLFNWLLGRCIPAMDASLDLWVFTVIARVFAATVLARIISGALNFILNKRYVFGSEGSVRSTLPKYLCVFALNMVLSGVFTSNLHVWLSISEFWAKMIGDTLLFLLGYYVQRKWVFAKPSPAKKQGK